MNRDNLKDKILSDEEKNILLALVAIEKITTLKIHQALNKAGSILELASLDIKKFTKYFGKAYADCFDKFQYNLTFNFEKYFEFYGTDYLFYDSEYYPKDLFRLYDFPFILFYRGNKDLLLFKRKLSIVGTRNNTKYSENALNIIIPYLVENYFVVVSGLASGVDGLSHIKTIRNKGYTIGVIAHGHNIIYPEENKSIYQIMEKKHLILSEYFPTSKIQRYKFLERNRIVAALSSGLLVTEVGVKSGTSRTIDYALDIGSNVFCLPGRFGDKMSLALNEYIRSGAIMLNQLKDLKEELHF